MRHFKIPLIVSAIVLVLMIAVGSAAVVWIAKSGGTTDRNAQMLGQGLAILTSVLVFPFWIYGAAQYGKERRERLAGARSSRKAAGRKRRTR